MSDLSNDTKKHTMKSRETIPLTQCSNNKNFRRNSLCRYKDKKPHFEFFEPHIDLFPTKKFFDPI
jgi:hypothetical protein